MLKNTIAVFVVLSFALVPSLAQLPPSADWAVHARKPLSGIPEPDVSDGQ